MNKTAQKIKDLPDWDKASVYKMNPPHEGHEYVVVSAVQNHIAYETYLFPFSELGEVTDWCEMDGSLRGTTDHEYALRNAGYSVWKESK